MLADTAIIDNTHNFSESPLVNLMSYSISEDFEKNYDQYKKLQYKPAWPINRLPSLGKLLIPRVIVKLSEPHEWIVQIFTNSGMLCTT